MVCCCALPLAWAGSKSLNADGLSYIDMANVALHDGPQALVNGYWSPLYPALIAVMLFVLRPSSALELLALHLMNWMIFLAVAACFTFFLTGWSRLVGTPQWTKEPVLRVWFAYGLLLWSAGQLTRLSQVTPDLCVAGVVFLAAGLCCRLRLVTCGLGEYALLGFTLGLGYYAKTAMFPIAVFLLSILLIWPPPRQGSRRRVLLSWLVFLTICAPLILLISRDIGRLSIGESGRLNYAWYVNNVQSFAGWKGGGVRMPVPRHAPDTLMTGPMTLLFRSPVPGTYPLWYDPSYWQDGAALRFDLKQQIEGSLRCLRTYGAALIDMSSLCSGVLVLSFFGRRWSAVISGSREARWFVGWLAAVCVMYALVHVEYRFLGPFVVLFWIVAFDAVLRHVARKVGSAVLATVLCSLLVPIALRTGIQDGNIHDRAIAQSLRRAGIGPGDELAIVGATFDAYYVRLAGARIVAKIVNAEEFSRLSPGELETAKHDLARAGLKAVIAEGPLNWRGDSNWSDLACTGGRCFKMLPLRPN